MIIHNVKEIKNRIAAACARVGRDPEEVRITAAAKGQPRSKILEAISAGIKIIGHNYIQECVDQFDPAAKVELHMIGHLQKNKANKAADLFDVIQTVDDPKLAAALDRRAEANVRSLGVMVQVNLGREPQKSGIDKEEIETVINSVRNSRNLRLLGLMTMPPFFDDPQRARIYFKGLRELRDELVSKGALTPEMRELSMGMTGDFEVAVEEGATIVRIGTALFGSRM